MAKIGDRLFLELGLSQEKTSCRILRTCSRERGLGERTLALHPPHTARPQRAQVSLCGLPLPSPTSSPKPAPKKLPWPCPSTHTQPIRGDQLPTPLHLCGHCPGKPLTNLLPHLLASSLASLKSPSLSTWQVEWNLDMFIRSGHFPGPRL